MFGQSDGGFDRWIHELSDDLDRSPSHDSFRVLLDGLKTASKTPVSYQPSGSNEYGSFPVKFTTELMAACLASGFVLMRSHASVMNLPLTSAMALLLSTLRYRIPKDLQ